MNFPAVARGMYDLLLPRVCVACDELMSTLDRGVVCGLCWSRVTVLPDPCCSRCGHPIKDRDCAWCTALPHYVRAVRSFCWYPGLTASRIVSAVKYQGWHVAAEEIAARMARLNFPADVREEAPSLIPVPLAPSRERDRGYNQSELLARSLARRWGLPLMVNCLRRCRTTVSQTKLTPAERAHNVAGAFSVAAESASSLQGAHLLLVDDVVTTSATLNECAAALFEAGARIVSYVTFGRAPSPGDMPLGPGQ